jgi:hypothetical protein
VGGAHAPFFISEGYVADFHQEGDLIAAPVPRARAPVGRMRTGNMARRASPWRAVSLGSQPVSEATPRAPVDEEPHDPAMRTASRESWAITAWAYAKQARMSSGSRSG